MNGKWLFHRNSIWMERSLSYIDQSKTHLIILQLTTSTFKKLLSKLGFLCKIGHTVSRMHIQWTSSFDAFRSPFISIFRTIISLLSIPICPPVLRQRKNFVLFFWYRRDVTKTNHTFSNQILMEHQRKYTKWFSHSNLTFTRNTVLDSRSSFESFYSIFQLGLLHEIHIIVL